MYTNRFSKSSKLFMDEIIRNQAAKHMTNRKYQQTQLTFRLILILSPTMVPIEIAQLIAKYYLHRNYM